MLDDKKSAKEFTLLLNFTIFTKSKRYNMRFHYLWGYLFKRYSFPENDQETKDSKEEKKVLFANWQIIMASECLLQKDLTPPLCIKFRPLYVFIMIDFMVMILLYVDKMLVVVSIRSLMRRTSNQPIKV